MNSTCCAWVTAPALFSQPIKEVRVPSNQLQLTEVQLDEEIAKMLKANNPEAPKNIARYN